MPTAHITSLIGEARANAAAMLEVATARAAFPTWTVKAKAVADSPAWGIVLETESWQADPDCRRFT